MYICVYMYMSSSFLQLKYVTQAVQVWDMAWLILNDDKGWTANKGRDRESGQVMSKSYQSMGTIHKLEVSTRHAFPV